MGALMTAPITAAASCLGGCGAVLCGRLLESGTVSTDRAAQVLLFWLQGFAVGVAIFASTTARAWVSSGCERLGAAEPGICECRGDVDCFAAQVIYRVQGAALVLFAFMLLLALSGCAQGAAKSVVVLKFFTIPALAVAFLFVPNSIFDGFRAVVGVVSACFLVAQAVLVIDFAYSWNERWYSQALMARRSDPGSGRDTTWQGLILAASAVLLVCSVAAAIALFVEVPSATTSAVLAPTLAAMAVLLVVSITDWCEHGSLLASAVLTAYCVWLSLEAIAAAPEMVARFSPSPAWLRALELSACAGTLVVLACVGPFRKSRAAAMGGSASEAWTGSSDTSESESEIDDCSFAAQCAVHAAASLYICTALVPAVDGAAVFVCRVASLVVALLLYGWSLVAPKVFPNRTF